MIKNIHSNVFESKEQYIYLSNIVQSYLSEENKNQMKYRYLERKHLKVSGMKKNLSQTSGFYKQESLSLGEEEGRARL